jgi:hypothetical protein
MLGMVQQAQKKATSGLTGFRKSKVLACLDDLADRRRKLRTLAGLLEACGNVEERDLDAEMVAHAAGMMRAEIEGMGDSLHVLGQRMPR